MKRTLTIAFAAILIVLSQPLCFAGDEAEDHICFKRIDSDHDEAVTFEEFKKFFGNDHEKFKAMDQDNDKKITHDEYEEYRYNQE